MFIYLQIFQWQNRLGKRRDDQPAILQVDAKQAHKDGLQFYIGNEEVWLCDHVPAEYLKRIK